MIYNELGTTGMKISQIGLGGAAFSSMYGPFHEAQGIELIREALNRGINYIETGPWYGQGKSEATIGKALKGVPRSSYFIGSKVGRYEQDVERMFDFSAEKTAWGVDRTLELLGLDYVDLIQVHDFTFAPDLSVVLKETLPTLAKAVQDGKARFIGVADYDLDLMKELIEESEIKISSVLSYAKSTLIDNRLQNYTGYFASKGVGVINASLTGMGLLTSKGPQPWHPASDDIQAMCRKASAYCQENKVDLAKLATWFSVSQPGIASHLCGVTDLPQLECALHAASAGLTTHEANVLRDLQHSIFKNSTYHWDDVELPAYKEKRLWQK